MVGLAAGTESICPLSENEPLLRDSVRNSIDPLEKAKTMAAPASLTRFLIVIVDYFEGSNTVTEITTPAMYRDAAAQVVIIHPMLPGPSS